MEFIYSASNVSEFFVSAMFVQPERQFFCLFNTGKFREMGKVCKNMRVNVEKQSFFADP